MSSRTSASRAKAILDAHGIRMAKYLTGSVVAMVVSTVTFMGLFGPGILGSKGASLTASATGAIVNYFMNRRWTWGRTGRGNLRREVAPYWGTVIVTAIAAAGATWGANEFTKMLTPDRAVRTVVNTGVFLAVYGLSFLVKYRIFDRIFKAATLDDDVSAVDITAVEPAAAPLPKETSAV